MNKTRLVLLVLIFAALIAFALFNRTFKTDVSLFSWVIHSVPVWVTIYVAIALGLLLHPLLRRRKTRKP